MFLINNYVKQRNSLFIFQKIRTFLIYFIISNHVFISIAQASFIPIEVTNTKHTHHFPHSLSDSLDFEKYEDHLDNPRGVFMRLIGKISDPFSRISTDIVVAIVNSASQKLDSFLEWTYKELKDISILKAKNMQEAVFDEVFWKGTFIATIEELHDKKTLTDTDYIYLTELQDLVWSQVLSPYRYSEGLQELKNLKTIEQMKKLEKRFVKKLKKYPALLEGAFKHDILEILVRTQELQDDNLEFNNILTYYESLVNNLDYKDILLKLDINLKNQASGFAQKKLQEVRLRLKDALNAIDEVQYRHLALERSKQTKFLQELPFFYEELDDQGLWADVENYIDLSEKPILYSKSFSYPKMVYNLKKSINFAVHNPIQTVTLLLAAQVTTAAALNAFSRSQFQGPRDDNINYKNDHSPIKRGITNEFQITSDTTASSDKPALTYVNNNIFTAWQSGSYNDCYGRIIGPTGPITNEFLFGAMSGQCYNPSLAFVDNGNLYGVWEGLAATIYVARFNSSEESFTPNTPISIIGYSLYPVSTYSSNVILNIAWFNSDIYASVYGAVFNSSSNSLVTTDILLSASGQDSRYPVLAILPNGNIFGAWSGLRNNNSQVFGRLFDNHWNPLSQERVLSSIYGGVDLLSHSINVLSNGNIALIYSGFENPYYNIYGCVFNSTLDFITQETLLAAEENIDCFDASVLSLPDDRIFIVWSSKKLGDYDIYGRLLDNALNSLTTKFVINEFITGDQRYPATAISSDGQEIIVTWYKWSK